MFTVVIALCFLSLRMSAKNVANVICYCGRYAVFKTTSYLVGLNAASF